MKKKKGNLGEKTPYILWLHNEISRIASIEGPTEIKEEITQLDKVIKGLKVKKTLRGRYYYFYSYINLPKKPEEIKEPLGRCLQTEYNDYPEKYLNKKPDELKSLLDRSYIKS